MLDDEPLSSWALAVMLGGYLALIVYGWYHVQYGWTRRTKRAAVLALAIWLIVMFSKIVIRGGH